MRKIILYSAMSLDGFVARPDGSVDWLFADTGEDYGYAEFYERIDTTLMGNRTYQQVLTFGDFPYADKTNYVFNPQYEYYRQCLRTICPRGLSGVCYGP